MASDQDKLSEDWKPPEGGSADPAAAIGQPVPAESDSDTASWAAMMDADKDDRVLNQSEIDNLLGFDQDGGGVELSGVQALINSALVSYERLPMLEIVFDRLVRLSTTSLRNFTSDNVEVSLDSISSVRFVTAAESRKPRRF